MAQGVLEICVVVLLALLVSIVEDENAEGKQCFILRSNALTMLILRGGAACLVAQYIYSFDESTKAALIAGLVVFYLLRHALPISDSKRKEQLHL